MGETISYSFEVTNSGATTLTNVTVTIHYWWRQAAALPAAPSLHWHRSNGHDDL
ncbi:DUF7507 domain-containing protein [Nonlabens agnitus]|uniref:DUF7507 domain-containing protein n=1 Tax=Nonlabens agnitus TaxID=870484 RepID=UPI000D041B83|nr:hypothetical protein [Nonlabens agnitus]